MRIVTILLSLSISLNVLAQDYKFGKISKEELQETYNPIDSSASATYLYKYRKTHFEYSEQEGFQLITEIHERIKIYNQEGFEYATKTISLYKNGSTDEEVSNLKAYTYNLVGGKIEDTKLEKQGIFKTEKSKYRNEEKFTMPKISEGSIIEYRYKIYSPFFSNVDDFIFQNDIPIKKLIAIFEAPEYFSFKLNVRGFLKMNQKKVNKNGSFNLGNDKIDFIKECYEYKLTNIPALIEEPYVNNINNYRLAVRYELSYTKFPNSTFKHYSSTWEDVVKTIYKNSNFGGELKKSGYYENDIDALISSVSDPMKKAFLIFDHVKSRVKWNGYYSKYTNDGVKKAYKDQVGNVAEINLMLTSMLRYAGLNANPILVSTRHNGIPLFPTREGYNYVITGIEVKDDVILLDATSTYSTINVLPFRTLNWKGRIIRESGSFSTIDLYPKQQSKNTTSMMINLLENGDIEGGFRSVKTNHDALRYRQKYNTANEDDFLEKLENKYEGLEISDFKVTNALNLSKPIMESYKFFKESQADIIGDKIYFSPLFYLRTNENPFKLEKREFPVDFGYPLSGQNRIIISIPEGYNIESVPKPKVVSLPDNLGTFKYNIVASENKIQFTLSSTLNSAVVSPVYYEALKEFFNQMIEKEAEQIVLTRI
ncbi:hypothetical protein GCM10023311_17810 [Flaviramulus aquimarinus]|uniref:DUF3857 domain-containing protein n=1 Tax=Flaviramulus aquimarinus TaxID=1170456 RepID=A0ABP9F673_9FLAO